MSGFDTAYRILDFIYGPENNPHPYRIWYPHERRVFAMREWLKARRKSTP